MVIQVLLMVAVMPTMAQTGIQSANRYLGGGTNAPIKIEVFSCYQCPPCRDFYLDIIQPLLRDYASTNKVGIIYYEFPLNIHPYSKEAARYGEAARRLGQKQWQRVSQTLFQYQDQWQADEKKIDTVVAGVLSKVEMEMVRKLVSDVSVEQTIDHDIAEGHNRQIQATPTFFIHANGKTKEVVGRLSYPVLKNYIDQQLR